MKFEKNKIELLFLFFSKILMSEESKNNNSNEYRNEIILSEDQLEHFNRINNLIANNHSSILDTGKTGSGKTIIAANFARVRNISRIIVICNGSVQKKHWNDHKIKYELPIIAILSYDELRGSSSLITTPDGREMVPHGFLYKINGNFEPTEIFRQYVEEGLLLIPDECHLIKNDCGKTYAVKALSRYISIRNMVLPLPAFKSFNLFTSMTPFDEPDHVINFAMLCGIIRSDILYDKNTNELKGIIELYEYCNYFNSEKTNLIWGIYDIDCKNVTTVAYRLITEVLLRMISSFARNCEKNYLSKQTIFYAYFDIEPIGVELMKKALKMIKAPIKNIHNEESTLVRRCLKAKKSNLNNLLENLTINNYSDNELNNEFNRITNSNESLLNTRSGVIHGMITTQTVKSYYCATRFIRKIFDTVENCKVIVFLNYKEAINIIMRNLEYFNPVKITGDSECTENIRNDIISKFNEPNLESRLLIIISQIGSDGIELDDSYGNFPRISLAFPDFYHSRFFQCPGRTLRRFTKSNSLYFLILVNSEECPEESVFKSITNKSKVMEETLRNNEIIPPTSYEKIINPDVYDLNELLRNAGMAKREQGEEVKENEKIIKINRSSITKNF